MTARDTLSVGLRHVKSGLVGVLLVVFATAVGVALAASTSAFIQAYRQQTKILLNNPVYREVRVRVPSFGDSMLDLPVVETDLKDAEGGSFTAAEMRAAATASPAVQNAFVVQRMELITTGALLRSEKDELGAVRGKATGESTDGKADTKSEEEGTADVLFTLPIDSIPSVLTTADFFEAYDIAAPEGFLFTPDDIDAGNLVIVLGNQLAKTLFPEDNAPGKRISLYYETFTVVGVLEPSDLSDPTDMKRFNELAFVPHAGLESKWGKRLGITDMHFTAAESSDVRAAVNQLTAYFESAHPGIDVDVSDSVVELRKERLNMSRVIAVLVFLSILGLFIAAINLLNLMLIRIIKHTKGIGIMRALGTTRREIFVLFWAESVLMCAAGAIIGLVASPNVYGLLQTTIVSGAEFSSASFGLDLILGGIVGFGICAVFGLYPALVAKNTDTTLALRAE